jgi:hypothetical protein
MEVLRYRNGVTTVNGIPFVDDIFHAGANLVRGTVDVLASVKNKVSGSAGGGIQYMPNPNTPPASSNVSPWLIGGLAVGAGLVALIVLKD